MKGLKLRLLIIIIKLMGQERIKKLISALARHAKLDLLVLAYNNMGILKFKDNVVSGEYFFLTKILKNLFSKIEHPVIFDVGANVGEYSLLLMKEYPNAKIYAFEPNENTFQKLEANVGHSVKCINAGLGKEAKTEKIYSLSDNLTSSHASVYRDVLSNFHRIEDIAMIDCQLTTIDLFCELESVHSIDFLKIDTEGGELNVLMGARKLLSERKIKVIQFEFGECDVFSRVFLKDFYTLLSEYNIHRLDTNRLVPLFDYDLANEIFRYQNLIAVRKDFTFQEI